MGVRLYGSPSGFFVTGTMATAILALVCIWLHVSSASESHHVLSVYPQNQSVAEDGTSTFTCHADFHVDCETNIISWSRQVISQSESQKVSRCGCVNDSYVDERYSVHLNSSGHTTVCTLAINNVTSADSGKYSCAISGREGIDTSSLAFLTVTGESVCQTHHNLSTRVTQKEELTVGSEGTFRCDIHPHQDSSTFRWLVKKADNQTIFLNSDDRFAISANRLTISPVLASDNGSQIQCQAKFSIMYTTDCEKISPWYQMLVVAQTRNDAGLNFPTQLPTQPLNAIFPSPTQIIIDADTGSFMVLWLVIGGILAFMVLVAIILIVVFYRRKHRKPPNRSQVDQAAPTLRRFVPNPVRDSHIYSGGVFPARPVDAPNIGPSTLLSSIQRPTHPQQGDVYAVLDTRQDELSASSGPPSTERAGNGSNRIKRIGPDGTLTRVHVGEDLYTLPSEGKLDNTESSDDLSEDSSKSGVGSVRFTVGKDLYTMPHSDVHSVEDSV